MIMTTMTFMLLMSAFHLRVPSDSIFLLLVAVSYHIFPRRLWSYSFVFVQGFRCPAVSSYTLYAPAVNSRRAPTVNMATSRQQPPGSADYRYLGACSYSCQNCRVLFWGEERSKSVPRGSRPRYNRCCRGGRVVLRTYEVYPEYMKLLLRDRHFLDNIRAYNQMGAQIDYSINNGRGSYVFKISGQLYHWIGSLCPAEGEQFRMSYFGGQNSDLRRNTVEGLIDLLDTHNGLLSTRDMLGAIVYETGPETDIDYDIVLEGSSGYPQRINKLHPSYTSLQFPLLFIYGQDGYSKDLKMIDPNRSSSDQKRLTMLAFYSYQLHDRANCYNYLSRTGRNEYLSGIYDAINRGDSDGSDCGLRLILPQSFTVP
ncbi:hypothetical protein Tco_0946024 [Tanacetum coccineum]